MTHNDGHVHGQLRTAPVKPRAVLWDLFGDHLRYVNGGTVPMRALTALLDALGRKAGPEDTRMTSQRHHDALEEACRALVVSGGPQGLRPRAEVAPL